MEGEQKLLEQAQMEMRMEMEAQEAEAEETTQLVRKSRNGNDKNETEIASGDETGVSLTNGHKAHSELVENGGAEETPAEEHKLNGLLQNDSEAINGDQTPKNIVFFDNVEGIWKCRLCSWAYRNGKAYVDHIQNHKAQLHKLMNLKVFNFESKGVESESTHLGVNQTPGHIKLQISSREFVDQSSSTSTISSSDGEEVDNNNSYEPPEEIKSAEVDNSNSYEPPKEIESAEVDNSNSYEPPKEIESAEVDLINEDDLEVTDLDVEGVLQKQTTHDLYCPNCNSCITKRVILRKRKRVIRVSDQVVKRRPGSILDTGLIQSPSDQVDHNAPLLVPNEDDHDKGPDLFRCLSCFSFFIPCGNGWKLFRMFGDKSRKENVGAEQAVSVKKNWFTSMFGSGNGKVVDQGNGSQTDVQRVDTVVQSNLGPSLSQTPPLPAQASQVGDMILHFPNQRPLVDGNLAKGVGDLIDMNGTKTIDMNGTKTVGVNGTETTDAAVEQFNSYAKDKSTDSKSGLQVHIGRESENVVSSTELTMTTQVTNSKHGEDTISFSKDDGLTLLLSSRGPLVLDDSKQLQTPGQTMEPAITGHVHPTPQQTITKTHIEYHSQTVDNTSWQHDATTLGKDTVITIDTQTTEVSQTQGVINPTDMSSAPEVATQIGGGDLERTEWRKEVQIEVVKSIIYGGLAESVTSLSVVASAAGGGAATLNVLALGAANLIGGLFIICHNLWDLKSDRSSSEQLSNQIVEQSDRYRELLGRRQNFIFHFIVAIISYLIFGLVPPVVYGFSFQESNDQQLKLMVVGAATLLCILILAIGKAYTQRPPKPYFKTVTTYVILGFMASGVSYAAGELAERLLNKLGLFRTGPASNLLVPEMRPTGSGWASY